MKKKEATKMTAAELGQHIGKEGLWSVNTAIYVKVKIVDARESFGRLDFQVTPVAGNGKAWVDSNNVQFKS